MSGVIPNLTVPSKLSLAQLINTTNAKAYTLAEIGFTAPSVLAGNPSANTQVTVASVPGQGYTGTKTVFYNRVDLQALLYDQQLFNPTGLSGTSVLTLLSDINSQLGLALQAYELVDAPVNLLSDTSFTLTISNYSEVWLPGSTVVVDLLTSGTFIDFGGGNLFGLGSSTLLDFS